MAPGDFVAFASFVGVVGDEVPYEWCGCMLVA